jgi:hypothetical protein
MIKPQWMIWEEIGGIYHAQNIHRNTNKHLAGKMERERPPEKVDEKIILRLKG